MNILFIGNSYTYYNDLPTLFQKLARENGQDVTCYSVTCGGHKLWEYVDGDDEYTKALAALSQEHVFDAVFLQDHSLITLLDYDRFFYGVSHLMEKLDPCAKQFVLYETWGRRPDHPVLAEHGWTNQSMTEDIAAAYRKAATALSAALSPVGENFYKVRLLDKALRLYDPDATHPSYEGSCLAALTHYHTLFGVMPATCESFSLPKSVEALFRTVIEQ